MSPTTPKRLTLAVKSEYFDAIRDGTKLHEFRLVNDYWEKRLVGRHYDEIEITKGYPAKDDLLRRMLFPYKGYRIRTLTHKHFGDTKVRVFALPVGGPEIAGAD